MYGSFHFSGRPLLNKILQKLLNKKLVVFGTGQLANEIINDLWFSEIDCFFDNDKNKWSQEFNGQLIHCPDDLLLPEFKNVRIIIASMYYDDIAAQLSAMGYVKDVDFFNAQTILFCIRGRQKFPAGHFYSTIPDLKEALNFTEANEIADYKEIHGIDFNVSQQFEFLQAFKENFYSEQPFASKGLKQKNRYYFGNNLFEHCDAITLYCMLRHLTPKRVIEVGSGFSSAVMLDTNEQFLDYNIEFTFIEPYPETLNSLLTPEDKQFARCLSQPVQSVDLTVFTELEPGDILFIDSSHVSKIGSDVNHIVFNILPILKVGVFIHFHDMFYPFIYPKMWIKQGRFWNETYLLRAFLQNNSHFSIQFWGHFLHECKNQLSSLSGFQPLIDALPLCQENTGGSLWLKKIHD